MSQRVAALFTFLGVALGHVRPARAILMGNYVRNDTSFLQAPYRGAVRSGGGSGLILFTDGDEAVVLTVAHGYDLTSMNATEKMDDKLTNDGGLSAATGVVDGYVKAGDNIIAENLGLFMVFQFDDRERCEERNAGRHSGALDDPYACHGVGFDIDLALQRIKLTPDARAAGFSDVELFLDLPSVGMDVLAAGYGSKWPCYGWMDDSQRSYNQRMDPALKTARSRITAVTAGDVYTLGPSGAETDEEYAKFGCTPTESVNACASRNGSFVDDDDFGERWGSGCSGDSGGAWFVRENETAAWRVAAVTRSSGKKRLANSRSFDMDDDDTFTEVGGMCHEDEEGDRCQSYGNAIALLHPARAQIKAALRAWNPAWASKARYRCEPPMFGADPADACGAGCRLCRGTPGMDGARTTTAECLPNDYPCESFEELANLDAVVCGEIIIDETTTPRRGCDPETGPACRAITPDPAGWRQEHVCVNPNAGKTCPVGYTCCETRECSHATETDASPPGVETDASPPGVESAETSNAAYVGFHSRRASLLVVGAAVTFLVL
jgi:hypothetical protein